MNDTARGSARIIVAFLHQCQYFGTGNSFPLRGDAIFVSISLFSDRLVRHLFSQTAFSVLMIMMNALSKSPNPLNSLWN